MKNNFFVKIKKNIASGLDRFPQAVGASTACTIIMILIRMMETSNNKLSFVDVDTLVKCCLVIALLIPISVGINLYNEVKPNNKIKILMYVVAGLFVIVYYKLFLIDDNFESATRYLGTTLILWSGIFTIQYFAKREGFQLYIMKTCTRFFTTVLYSVILFLGVCGTFMTIEKLLNINVEYNLYFYAWLIIVGVFAMTFFLAGIPKHEEKLQKNDYSNIVKVLLLYIVIPLLLVYTSILYSYFIKIAIVRVWPEIMVSHLVLWYSIVGVSVLFFTTSLREDMPWVNKFHKYFPCLNIPLLLMMFMAMLIRVKAYGITANRYLVLALGVWVLISMIHFVLAKKNNNILVFICFVAIAVLAVYSHVSAYNVSKISQNNRFKRVLIENNLYEDGKIIKTDEVIKREEQQKIISIINYFRRTHSVDDIKLLPKGFDKDMSEDIFGFKFYYHLDLVKNIRFNINLNGNIDSLKVSGYDYIIESGYSRENVETGYHTYFEEDRVTIKYQSGIIFEKNLSEFVHDKIGNSVKNPYKELDIEELTIIEENEKYDIKIIIERLGGEYDKEAGTLSDIYGDCKILLKENK